MYIGRYSLIENLMKFFIGLMFIVVLASAILANPDWLEVLPALLIPRAPAEPQAVVLTLGIIGGVGGSVTLLCYAYWLKEKNWQGAAFLRHTRIDLGVAYLLTSLFGIAVIIIASGLRPGQVEGYDMILSIAGKLEESAGPFGKWAFMIGFWGAVFSSMLGVWDGVPYLFADFVETYRNRSNAGGVKGQVSSRSPYYRAFLAFLALPPILLVVFGRPAWVGIAYAVTGAFFMPFLAALLLYMNNRKEWVGRLKNNRLVNAILVGTLVLFLVLMVMEAT